MQESVEAIERISSYIIVKQVSLKSAPYTPDQGTLSVLIDPHLYPQDGTHWYWGLTLQAHSCCLGKHMDHGHL